MTSFFPFSRSLSFPSSTSQLVSDDPHLQVTVTPSASAFYAGETFSVSIKFTNTRTPSVSQVQVPPTPGTVPRSAEAISAVRTLPSPQTRGGSPVTTPQPRGKIGLIPRPQSHSRSPPASHETISNDNHDNADAGPSRYPTSLSLNTPTFPSEGFGPPGYPYSPGANPAYRAPGWPGTSDDVAMIRSPDAWRRKEYGGVGGRELGHGRRARSLAIGKQGLSPQEMVWALGGQPSEQSSSLSVVM